MWTVVYVSSNLDTIYKLCDRFAESKVIYRRRPLSDKDAGEELDWYEILVPSAELGEAQSIVFEEEI